jgi:hypothetical protein
VIRGGIRDASERAEFEIVFSFTFLACDCLEKTIEIVGCVIDIPFNVIIGEPDIIKYNLLPVLLFRYANMNISSNANTNINLVSSDAVDK